MKTARTWAAEIMDGILTRSSTPCAFSDQAPKQTAGIPSWYEESRVRRGRRRKQTRRSPFEGRVTPRERGHERVLHIELGSGTREAVVAHTGSMRSEERMRPRRLGDGVLDPLLQPRDLLPGKEREATGERALRRNGRRPIASLQDADVEVDRVLEVSVGRRRVLVQLGLESPKRRHDGKCRLDRVRTLPGVSRMGGQPDDVDVEPEHADL